MLAAEIPASFVAFDLLALGDDDLMDRPFGERRALLEGALGRVRAPVHLTRVSADMAEGRSWFEVFEGAGLDGLVCKLLDAPYQPDKRVMLKVKHARTADCVVAGWRPHKQPGDDGRRSSGSLMLGLYDEAGVLQSVGVAASFTMARRAELVDQLAPLALGPDDVAPVVGVAGGRRAREEPAARRGVAVDRRQGPVVAPAAPRPGGRGRLRRDGGQRASATPRSSSAGAPTVTPESCTYEQLERPVRYDLADVLEG